MSFRWEYDRRFKSYRLMYSPEYADFIVSLHPSSCNFYIEDDSKLSELLNRHRYFNQNVSMISRKKIIDAILTGLLL